VQRERSQFHGSALVLLLAAPSAGLPATAREAEGPRKVELPAGTPDGSSPPASSSTWRGSWTDHCPLRAVRRAAIPPQAHLPGLGLRAPGAPGRGAIVECEKAIQIDPDYGNPWNDIGSYLLAKGDLDRAIPYLKRATEARRYCCPQFPHLNLGGIYAEQRRYREAKREFERVLELVPGHLPAIMALKQIEALLAHEAPERI
jgi:hypothetical protein